MKLSDDVLAAVMDRLFGGQALPVPSDYDIGLSSTRPNDDGTGITEPTVNGYARVTVANDLTTFAAADAAARSKTNAATITFPTVTDTDSPDGWGPLAYVVLFDNATDDYSGGGLLGTLLNPQTGDAVEFAPGDFTINGPGS
ncbi:MAG: hypothetical protein JWM40_2918 [Frankiales bacterium]|nr:hypothetical protein [Frankiales bacterium]